MNVTIQQIKTLFSRMSSEQRKGTLKEPKSSQADEETVLSRNVETIDDNEIRETACSVLPEILDLKFGIWYEYHEVICKIDATSIPGRCGNNKNRGLQSQTVIMKSS